MKIRVHIFNTSTSELEGIQAHLHKPPRLKGTQEPAQGQAPPLFIAPKPNRAIGAKLLVSARAPDRAVPGTGHGGALPNGQIPMAVGHRIWVAVALP
jgi:hypothetical protein